MKKLLLSCILFFSISFVFAQIDHQVESSTSNEEDIDYVFQNLDKADVTTGVLCSISIGIK